MENLTSQSIVRLGLGRESKFLPYISTLPLNPSCGYSPLMRSEALEAISVMRVEMDMDVNGWSGEIASKLYQVIRLFLGYTNLKLLK